MPAPSTAGRLLIACPDARGIVAAVTGFISEHGGNLLDAEQHTDHEHGEFVMRVVFDPSGCDPDDRMFEGAWARLVQRHRMRWRIRWSHVRKRMAILVGRQPHCLQELLWRVGTGELGAEIAFVASNHPDLRETVEHAGIPFHHHPIEDGPGAQARQEADLVARVDAADVDLVVLARYMRVLGPAMLDGRAERIINIHHSFLPAFAGGDPYRQAYDRGVKLIGATSHYVTEVLDDGPIIAQDVTTVDHHDSVADLRRRGRDLERLVLARAVAAHCEDRILVTGGKTVVFR